jgi:predicted ATPase
MFAQLARHPGQPLVFFDRGLPDIIAYLRHAGFVPHARLFRAARDSYTPLVFLAPAWAEIYAQDTERPQGYLEAVALHAEIERAYRECGFEIALLPRVSVPERVAFVEATLAATPMSSP